MATEIAVLVPISMSSDIFAQITRREKKETKRVLLSIFRDAKIAQIASSNIKIWWRPSIWLTREVKASVIIWVSETSFITYKDIENVGRKFEVHLKILANSHKLSNIIHVKVEGPDMYGS